MTDINELAKLIAASLRFEQNQMLSRKEKYKRIDFGMFSPDRYESSLSEKGKKKHSSTCFWNCYHAALIFYIEQGIIPEEEIQKMWHIIEEFPFPADLKEISSRPEEGDHPISDDEIKTLAEGLDFNVEVIDSGDNKTNYNPNGSIKIRVFLFNGHYTLIVNDFSEEEIERGLNTVTQFVGIVGKRV